MGGLPDRDPPPPGQRPPRQRPPGQRPPWTDTPWTDPSSWTDNSSHPPPSPPRIESQTGVKTLPCRNFVVGGKYGFLSKIRHGIRAKVGAVLDQYRNRIMEPSGLGVRISHYVEKTFVRLECEICRLVLLK